MANDEKYKTLSDWFMKIYLQIQFFNYCDHILSAKLHHCTVVISTLLIVALQPHGF